jgi:acyl-ACP thioesterase
MKGYIHKERFVIRAREIGADNKLSLPSLIEILQEASFKHAIGMKASFWDMQEEKLSWVLLKKELEVFRYADAAEEIEVHTYPSDFDRLFATRDFFAFDKKGNKIAQAKSLWTLINTETRKMENIPESMRELIPKNIENSLGKPDVKIRHKFPYVSTVSYKINYLDIDWNNHTNNNIINRQIIKSTPLAILQNNKPFVIKVFYRSESLLGHDITITSTDLHDNQTYYKVDNLTSGKTLAVASCEWK